MADSKQNQGYQCEFLGSVPDNLLCQKCKFVARKLIFTSCCGESYCHDCIAKSKQQEKTCPACGEKDFNLLVLLKYIRQIENLHVYCTQKHRGCGWTGLLGQLQDHLEDDKEGCQYVDTKCPLNCSLAVPKNELQHHMEQLCNKRKHVCQHCGFKATYEEVVNIHLPECKYVPLRCPNHCGVTCEREDMEDHLKMCRLEDVACEFSGVGCEDRFPRENEEEHIYHKSQSHLSMTAATLVTVNQQLQHRVQEQQDKIQDLEKKVQDQHQKIQDQDQKIQDQDQAQNMQYQEKKLQKQDQKIQDLQKTLQAKEQILQSLEMRISQLEDQNILSTRFTVDNFSINKNTLWIPVYTHTSGYKFQIAVYPDGGVSCKNKALLVELHVIQGEYDDQLVWPAQVKFTLKLVNQKRGDDVRVQVLKQWAKPSPHKYLGTFHRLTADGYSAFEMLCNIDKYLYNDSLHFLITTELK